MKRDLFSNGIAWIAVFCLSAFFRCSENYGVNPFDNLQHWTFSGKVVDSYTNNALPGVTIQYLDDEGIFCSTATNVNGIFKIEGLPLGQCGFTFSRDSAGSGALRYIRRDMLIAAGSTNPDSMLVPINIYIVVKLYPLAGSMRGKVLRRYFASAPATPAIGVKVKARFIGDDAFACSPAFFTRTTDSTGLYEFTGLPISENLRLGVINEVFQDLTYQCQTIVQPALDTGMCITLAPFYMEPLDLKNSMLTFIYSNVYDFVNQKSLTMIPVDSTIVLVANKKIASIAMLLRTSSSSPYIPTENRISGDTVYIKPLQRLRTNTTHYLYLNATAESGETKTIDYYGSGYITFTTIHDKIAVVASNVLSKDGTGLQQVPVDITPYFVLSCTPKPATVSVDFSGYSTIKSYVWVNGDTVFADPVTNFPSVSYVTTTINGTDTAGNRIYLTLSGDASFKTDVSIYLRESNIFDPSGSVVENVPFMDTLWLRFSQQLDTSKGSVVWYDPNNWNAKTIWGDGPAANAEFWVHDSTLFILPDERSKLEYGDRIAFRVQVRTPQGTKSTAQTFQCVLEKLNLYLTYNSTIDSFGRMREDVGVMEPIVLIANQAIHKIDRVSATNGLLPPGINLSSFSLKKDTIIYTPQLAMVSTWQYGFSLDVTLCNGAKVTNAFSPTWKILEGAKVLFVDNKTQEGRYRMLNIVHDSFSVTFSEPIDTSAQTIIPFRAHILDGFNKEYHYTVRWNAQLTKATIYPADTLLMADAFASPGYTNNSPGTRAVASVVFDLTTQKGVGMNGVGLSLGNIELHSEPGLCVCQTNLLQDHPVQTEVVVTQKPVGNFHPDSAIIVSFNRALDTLAIKTETSRQFFVVADESGSYYPCAASFAADARTVRLVPEKRLQAGKKYYLRVSQVPGAGIRNARAVNKHGGCFSGKGTMSILFESSFMVQNPDISSLTVSLLPDSNTALQPGAQRFGYSAGFSYSRIVGIQNSGSESQLIVRLKEAAWNINHEDSVSGYQVQAQRIDRSGRATPWYPATTTLPTTAYSPFKDGVSITGFMIGNEAFYTTLTSQDLDGQGAFYQNSLSLLNDSARILLKVKPYVGDVNSSNCKPGAWSNAITIIDNVAPCDQNFVTGLFCDSIGYGGVNITSTVVWNNQTGATVSNGYIQLDFPEDMDIRGTAPVVSLYMGRFKDSIPPQPPTFNQNLSRWVSARSYRCAINVPPYDYTHHQDSTGAYFNLSVAGCRDIAGNTIPAYGTDGVKAQTGVNMIEADDKIQGSASVIRRFWLCL